MLNMIQYLCKEGLKNELEEVNGFGLVQTFAHDKLGRFCPINNSSLLGTIKFACEGTPLEDITTKAEFIDIGADGLFSELFFENMMF